MKLLLINIMIEYLLLIALSFLAGLYLFILIQGV
jgi:hypothetical protein